MKDSKKNSVAVKVSKIENPDDPFSKLRLDRFKTEAVKIFELTESGQEGIIPVYHYELPCEKSGKYFFVMPKAVPLTKLQSNMNLKEKIEVFKELAKTLVDLHNKNITHRDIKPENILSLENKYCFGDFGLIDFPEKGDLTKIKESVGNRKTMAPEMRNAFSVEDSRPSDVYSFAKTLWIILCDEEFAFDGQFNFYENNKLQNKYDKQHFVELHQLLADSTAENPEKRPTIEEFLNRLLEWESITQDKRAADKSLWRFLEQTIVKQKNPSTVIWRDKLQVVDILKNLSKLNFNHTFLSEGGGMDLIATDLFEEIEEDMIVLSFGFNMKHVFKLNKLIWELPNNDPEFSYFRLEFDRVNPIYPSAVQDLEKWMKNQKIENVNKVFSEDLIVNSSGEYEAYSEDDEITSCSVTRWFNGSFLIVPKNSIYNSIQNTYDGRHSKFKAEEFREYMEILQYIYNHEILKSYFWDIANRDPFKENLFVELRQTISMTAEELENKLGKDTKN
ncbi:serine/threonine-protein kinase [Bacillus horti]|uniref:Serine/threonine-protein kinase n=2 Tax=Caldalkalibacillus horti TaxID=77523 RepID=A0ABT9VYT5_9BACI|nr:serine/threonine-protein kinase [Bacillus horti]